MQHLTMLLALLPSAAATAPDTLVVCPAEYRAALRPWVALRRQQGHALEIAGAPASAAELDLEIRAAAAEGRLRFVLLVGDAPTFARDDGRAAEPAAVPTHYEAGSVNVRWGSPPHIATDHRYADVDADGIPDLAVGRLPVDSADELANVVDKIVRYERDAPAESWQRKINIVAGVGHFGPTIDCVVEAAARRLITDLLPDDYTVELTHAPMPDVDSADPHLFRAAVRRKLTEPSQAWIYLGHAHVQFLDVIPTEQGPQPMLTVGDLAASPLEAPSTGNPLAVLLACYTGAFDATADCLAEKLLVQPGGPVAVLAATRVSMPYGNTVLGYELLRASFAEDIETLGEVYLTAQRRTLAEAPEDTTRKTLDQLARGLTPPPVDLPAERREHVWMYQLLGDPLLKTPDRRASVRVADGAKATTK